MKILLVFIFYVSTSYALRAEVLSATAIGRTINTGIEQELLTKRAKANALENFLLHNGAKIQSITIVEEGEIAFDQIRLNTEHRLLGFDVLQHKKTKEYTEVTLKVYYGNIDASQQCRDRNKLEIQFTGVTADVSPYAPAFLIQINKHLHQGIKNLSKNMDFLKMVDSSASVGRLEFALDYAALAAAQNISKEIITSDTLSVNVKVTHVSSSDEISVHFHTSSSNKKLERIIGTVSTNANISVLSAPLFISKVPRPRTEVFADLINPYLNELNDAFTQLSCEPISTTLRKEGDQYRVEIGSQDGVRKSSVFLFENGLTSGFGVKKLLKNETHLIPLQTIFPLEPTDGASLYLVK